jgi:predicted  nucleic acid-binding Zn-ribbon protein
LGLGVDKPNPICYNKDKIKEREEKKMKKIQMTEQELREIKNRLDVLYTRANELKHEMADITQEIFNLEFDILMRIREE